MSARQHVREGGKALPLDLIAQAIPMLSRHELAALADRLIDAIDSVDGDCDLEDNHDQEAIDEREPDSHGGAGYWDLDQRFSVPDSRFPQCRNNVDRWPFR